MKTYLNMATLLAGLVAAGAALADGDECHVPMSQWQPREALLAMVADQGWTVRRIRTEDGCYKIKGRDTEGREIEVKVDPATLAMVDFEFDDNDDDDDRGRGRGNSVVPTEALAPPANELFVPSRSPVVE
ncbi:hypothetical protein PH5382_02787 [Phaeobacter sp. CECT 5382]|uniref:PepSY domain-containing protein n=1 Tax=Phaeobacter sp. CECT 5382 TaxID=1712645 RepID=UPI0006DA16F6|nr:PepSY domain-containing protein [Phaeobacter sp. CECT 5382]CUH88843.1 hypothetical protein PH5382_02787 [Phaeobacter sp. CECT 5382]